jgi:citrate lyase beta subunit
LAGGALRAALRPAGGFTRGGLAMTDHVPSEAVIARLAQLNAPNAAFNVRYPGEAPGRQPVHTVYGGGHLFRADTAPRLGGVALKALAEFAPDAAALDAVLELGPAAGVVYRRIVEKLQREPVEDFRIDFEDGYGNRVDAEEDSHVAIAAHRTADGLKAGSLPPFIGIRIKPLTEELRARSVRTLSIFLGTLLKDSGGRLPPGFVVTLPKITVPEQVSVFVEILSTLERELGLDHGALRFEVMIETPQAVLGSNGISPLPLFLDAAAGRLSAAHFGTYDYTAGLGITAAYQRMRHPACDFAKHMMQVAYAGTGIWLSDGSTAVLPVPLHRAAEGSTLSAQQLAENRDTVHSAWKLHYDDIRHSLKGGFYQGWDLHPAQLVTRYAALFNFFIEGLEAAGVRLTNFVAKAAQATLVGDVFDDAATGQGLLNYFLRGINSGAVTEEEAVARSGLTVEEIRGRSFVKILATRAGR